MSRSHLRNLVVSNGPDREAAPPPRARSHPRRTTGIEGRPSSRGPLVVPSPHLLSAEELSSLLRKLDEIADSLGSRSINSKVLRHSLRESVLCVVRQVIAQRELCTLALTDDLTGLYNRRGFLAAAAHQLKLARRESRDSLLFFADLDNLKTINDCYGHREGDLALVRVADALQRTFRDSDVLARMGGDEFTALAPNSSPYDQDIILRRLRKRLEEVNCDAKHYQVSLSIGVARFDPLHPASLGELVAQADRLMYEHKGSRPRFQQAAGSDERAEAHPSRRAVVFDGQGESTR